MASAYCVGKIAAEVKLPIELFGWGVGNDGYQC